MPEQAWLSRVVLGIENILASIGGGVAITQPVRVSQANPANLRATVVGTVNEYVPEELHDDTQVATGVAAALNLGVEQACVEVTVQADPGNGGSVFVGNDVSQSIELVAGQTETIRISDVSTIYVRTGGGNQAVNWHAVE